MASGGVIWTAVVASAIVSAIEDAAALNEADAIVASVGGYRPPQWAGSPLTAITVPGQAATTTAGSVNTNTQSGTVSSDTGVLTFGAGTTETTGTPDTVYVFDGVMRIDHDREIRSTEHAAQSSANFSDHAFIEAARLSLEVSMSDVMDSFIPNSWTGSGSKSVNAYQTIEALALARTFVTVTTRLRTYTNMLITRINAPDTRETLYGLKATFQFKEQFVGTTSVQNVSARTQTTDATTIGQKQSVPVPATIVNQNKVTSAVSTVPGAGTYSSDATAGEVIGS